MDFVEDWTVAEAKRYAVICRKHKLRCRVVRSQNSESYVALYRDEGDLTFGARRAAARQEALAAGWVGFEKICAARPAGEERPAAAPEADGPVLLYKTGTTQPL